MVTQTSRWDTGFPDPEQLRETARQARQLPTEPTSRGVRAIVGGAVAVWLVTVLVVYSTLPERVPTHWDGSEPDDWSSRAGALVAFVVGPIAIGAVLRLVTSLVLRWPQGINAPNKEYWLQTPQRLRHFERLVREDLMLIGALTTLLFAAISVMTGVAAHREGGELPGVFFSVIMIAFMAGILGLVVRMLLGRRYQPSDEAV